MFQDLIFFVLFVLKSCTYSFADYKYFLFLLTSDLCKNKQKLKSEYVIFIIPENHCNDFGKSLRSFIHVIAIIYLTLHNHFSKSLQSFF